MATEIATTDNRAEMLNSMKPSKDQLTSEEYQAHRGRISFELERVSTKADRFGWGQMGEAMKISLLTDWADVLDPYRLAEVKAACAELLGSNPKQVTNEQQVKNVIAANRAKALARLPKQIAPEETRTEPSAEEKARILAVTEEYLSKRPRVKRQPIYQALR